MRRSTPRWRRRPTSRRPGPSSRTCPSGSSGTTTLRPSLKPPSPGSTTRRMRSVRPSAPAPTTGRTSPRGRSGRRAARGPQLGKVISIRGKTVFIDLGAKSEGAVPLDQFGENLPNPGDMIEVVVDRFDTDEGLLLLSLKGAAVEASWENLRKGLIVEANVTKANKGGVEVEVDGIRGFLPDQPARHRPRRGSFLLHRPEAPRRRHRGQPAREEPGRLPPRPARTGAGGAGGQDLVRAGGGPDAARRHPLDQGLWRVRRPRRRGRPPARRRHELGPHLRRLHPRPRRPAGRGQDPQNRPRERTGSASASSS